MPIHDRGYRRYEGARAPHADVWRAIARAGVVDRLRHRRFLALLLFAWTPFLVRALQIYVASSFTQASFLSVSARTFREFLDQQAIFVFFITIFAGAGLIANDRRSNALQLYFSRPVTRHAYVLGKALVVVLFLLAVTWAPATLLVMLQTMFAGNLKFGIDNAFLLPAIFVFAALQAAVSSLAILALSSLSTSSRFVAMMYTAIIFFTAALARILSEMTGNRAWDLLAPGNAFEIIGDVLFGMSGLSSGTIVGALLVLTAVTVGSLWILRRQVRGVEIVR
jgi:ABC-2 type transport system permease protein